MDVTDDRGPGRAGPAAVATFGDRLRAAVEARGALCVGIDPHAALLRSWGVGDDVRGLERFALTVVEALGDRVAVLKPQSAFFERFGSAGIAVLERVLAACRAAGALALLDVKRGDIGSTAAAYAAAYLEPSSPLAADAVTASPYLGFESLRPLLDAARRSGGGVFVLARTSNPEGVEVQQAVGRDGRTVAARILAGVRAANAAELDAGARWGSAGAVVGATLSGAGADLADLGGPVLAPGVGAQGATLADLPAVFGAALPAVVPAVSREILRHGPDPVSLRRVAEQLQIEFARIRTGGWDAPRPERDR